MSKWTQLSFSNIGKREENQDFVSLFSIKKSKRHIDVLIVCDGVGGRPNGKQCSEIIGNTIREKVSNYLRNRRSKSCLNENDLNNLKKDLCNLPKLTAASHSRTTLALVLFDRKKNKSGNSSIAFWAGDSRIYAIESSGKALQISNDQKDFDDRLLTSFTGEGELIGEIGTKYSCFKDPLLICVTSDGMNCQLDDLYKFFLACLYFGVKDSSIFEARATQFLAQVVSDNYSTAMVYKNHSSNTVKKVYNKISKNVVG